MKNGLYRAFEAKKRLVVLAVSALLVANLSAQEMQKDFKSKKQTKEERVELDIKRLTHELLLSDEQAQKFAVTYREYAGELDKQIRKGGHEKGFEPGKELTDKEIDKLVKQRIEGFKALADIQLKYYDKFRNFLSARQAEKVLQFKDKGCPKGFDKKPCCDKPDVKKCDKHDGPKFDKHDGPRPQFPQPAE